jgi:hypothetical protein
MKDPDPEPYVKQMDPDLEGPKISRSGSATLQVSYDKLTTLCIKFKKKNYLHKITDFEQTRLTWWCLCRKKCPPDEASKSQESRKRNGGRIKKEVLNPLYVYENVVEEEEEENGVEDEEEEEVEQDIKLFLNLGSDDEQQTKRIIKTRWEFVCERLSKKDYFERNIGRSPLASVAEPDSDSDLGFMTKNGNNLLLLKIP